MLVVAKKAKLYVFAWIVIYLGSYEIAAFSQVWPEMGIYRDNLSAITFYRLLLSLKIVWIYRLPLSLLLYILLSPINYRDKQFFKHAVFKLQS